MLINSLDFVTFLKVEQGKIIRVMRIYLFFVCGYLILCHTIAYFCVISYIQISIGYYPYSALPFVDIISVHTAFMFHDSL